MIHTAEHTIYNLRKVFGMKAKSGFSIKQVADSFVIVPVGERIVDFSAMITINETGAFLWEKLQNDVTLEELTDLLLAEYDTDKETAENDVKEFTDVLLARKVIE